MRSFGLVRLGISYLGMMRLVLPELQALVVLLWERSNGLRGPSLAVQRSLLLVASVHPKLTRVVDSWVPTRSILRGSFELIDDHDVSRRLGGFELQAQLLLECLEDVGLSVIG
jgi:hypothetical protein